MKKFHALVVTTASILALPVPAFAHAHLLSAVPAENQMAMPPPKELVLKFSEELNLKFTSVEIVTPDKKKVEVASEALDPKDAKVLIVELKAPLPDGKYTVNWKAFSQDGHKTNGSYTIDAMQ
jgi:copper resistance protein C